MVNTYVKHYSLPNEQQYVFLASDFQVNNRAVTV